MWDHVIRMLSHVMIVMMLMVMMLMGVLPSMADPVPDAEDPSISPTGIVSSGLGGLLNVEATELPPTITNLVIAVEEGNLENVKDLTERGVDINDYNGVALQVASQLGHLEKVKYLLETGANPNGSDDYRFMGLPLRVAAEHNYLDIINLLLDAGATAEVPSYGVGILYEASENGHLEAVKRLIEAGADPDFGRGYLLFSAAKGGHLDVINAFIEAGANVSAGMDGWIIKTAAENGHLQVVKALMKGGANTHDYKHAMKSAAANGHLDIVNLMLENGADPNYSDVLKLAAEAGHLEVVKTLLDAGSTIKYDDHLGSPLHFAAIGGHQEVVALLVEYGADINRAKTKDSWFDFTETFGKGWTVMHVAARFGHPMIEQLMELGADINLKDVKGWTPLQIAVFNGHLITVKELLRFCADLSPVNEKGMTALDIANVVATRNASNTTDYKELMELLQEVMPKEMVSSPGNYETMSALARELDDILKANSTLRSRVKKEEIRFVDIYTAIRYIFEDRAQKNLVKTIEDHKCNLSQQDNTLIDFGTEYFLTRCECVPGQGPMLTLTLIQDENMCGQREAVQVDSHLHI